ncbi:FliA/WhiG family RNA polymerase sigma factor [Roseateles sp. BYS78W]|uniref:FliA/WhiG family RNA polymerase sigma factor n=1 Tax=Pelomonas candidula TaxID=3299025 RepID=A0ABW7HGE7_9BURK
MSALPVLTPDAAAYGEWAQPAPVRLSPQAEQRALRSYAPLVKRVVRQLGPQASAVMDREDMEQVGLMGLLQALRRYGEPDDGFGAFASLRVRGAILDELRRQDWRPRTVRQDSHRQRDALRALTRRLGRQPTEAEILKELQLTPEAWLALQQAEVAEEMASFDEMLGELSELPSEQRTPEAQLMVTRSLAQALRQLDEREQKVIQLYYEYDASLKEIAAVLDLSEARISQINKAALRKMRAVLQAG